MRRSGTNVLGTMNISWTQGLSVPKDTARGPRLRARYAEDGIDDLRCGLTPCGRQLTNDAVARFGDFLARWIQCAILNSQLSRMLLSSMSLEHRSGLS
jgi:hypothetical protein